MRTIHMDILEVQQEKLEVEMQILENLEKLNREEKTRKRRDFIMIALVTLTLVVSTASLVVSFVAMRNQVDQPRHHNQSHASSETAT